MQLSNCHKRYLIITRTSIQPSRPSRNPPSNTRRDMPLNSLIVCATGEGERGEREGEGREVVG